MKGEREGREREERRKKGSEEAGKEEDPDTHTSRFLWKGTERDAGGLGGRELLVQLLPRPQCWQLLPSTAVPPPVHCPNPPLGTKGPQRRRVCPSPFHR